MHEGQCGTQKYMMKKTGKFNSNKSLKIPSMNAICLQIKNVSMEMRAAENIHTKTGVCLWYGSFHFGMHMNFS